MLKGSIAFWIRCVVALGRSRWKAPDEKERLVIELAAEAAGGIQYSQGNLRKRNVRGSRDDAVEPLDAKLLTAFIGNLKDAICSDDEEVAGRGGESKAIETRDREKADWKLGLLAL